MFMYSCICIYLPSASGYIFTVPMWQHVMENSYNMLFFMEHHKFCKVVVISMHPSPMQMIFEIVLNCIEGALPKKETLRRYRIWRKMRIEPEIDELVWLVLLILAQKDVTVVLLILVKSFLIHNLGQCTKVITYQKND